MKLKLIAKNKETPEVISFIFKPSRPLNWKAGQFAHYMLNHMPTDDRGSDRWFTIASASYERHLKLTTRFAKTQSSSFKKKLKALKPGDSIEISDVDGDFVVNDLKRHYVFIAGGIGITPFRSILKETAHAGTSLHVTLLYANRDKHVVFKKELESMVKQNPNLVIHYIFGPGQISKVTIKKLVPDLKKPLFYISGREAMVENVGNMLNKLGVPKKHIKQDWFPGYSVI